MSAEPSRHFLALSQDIKAFRHYVQAERGLAANTVLAYGRDLDRFAGWVAGSGLADYLKPSVRELTGYLGFLRDEGLAPPSVARHLIAKQEQVLITASCKMAVKAGDPMSHEEMKVLLEDLMQTTNPFMCPHGRPIIVSLSNWELDRKFRRV